MTGVLSVRQIGLLASWFLVIGSAVLLFVRPRMEGDPKRERAFCGPWPLCTPEVPAERAFQALRNGATGPGPEVIEDLKLALERDSASPYRWCDLGEAYALSGDLQQARLCYSRGLSLAKDNLVIRLRMANFEIQDNQQRKAVELMAGMLRTGGLYDGVIFSYYDRLHLPIDEILTLGMPVDQRAATSWFQHLRNSGRVTEAAQTWKWMAGHALGDERLAIQYAGQFISESKFAQADEAWSVYAASRPPAAESSVLRNGGFEGELSGVAFNWFLLPFDQAPAKIDCRVAHSGRCSLNIRFDARENIVFQHVWQTIVIKPGNYRFEAYMRSEDITTDQGVRFRIRDVEDPGRFEVQTEGIRGNTEWTRFPLSFQVPAVTRVVSIQVYRAASQRFENRIKGAVWIDDVSISPDKAVAERRSSLR